MRSGAGGGGDVRQPFLMWCVSKKVTDQYRTLNNTPDEFTVQLPPGWKLPGTWSVQVHSATTPEVDESKTHGDLMVYTDLIEYALVGHGYYPLLERIPYTGHFKLRYQESTHPFRRKINGTRHETINIKIADGNGRAPIWKGTQQQQVTHLGLWFQPETDTFIDTFMDQTFVSNQSKTYYPNNKANNFTARLPTIQRLGDAQWRVGCTKITLPPAVTETKKSEWSVSLEPLTFLLPSTARTTVTLSSMGSADELVQEFNTKMKALIASWFPTDANQAGFGGNTPQDRTMTLVETATNKTATLHMDGVCSFHDLYERLRAGLDMGGGQKSPPIYLFGYTDGRYRMYMYIPKGYSIRNDGLAKRLGFTLPLQITGSSTAQNKTYYLWDVPWGVDIFAGESYALRGLECLMQKVQKQSQDRKFVDHHVIATRFFDPKEKTQLKLTLPEGMYDMMGMNKTGLEIKTWDSGDSYIETVIKRRGVYPHSSDGVYMHGVPPVLFGNFSYLVNVQLKYSTTAVNSNVTPTTKKLEITNRSTATPQSKIAHVKCSLLDLQQVGDRRIPLLEIVPMSAVSAGGAAQPKQYVFEPKHVKYYPLVTSSFQSITFEVEDEDGNAIPFTDQGVATLTLRFEKR